MTEQTDPHDIQTRVNALLRDRQALKRVLPRILTRAEETYPPSLHRAINQHRIAVEEARLYAAGMGQKTIGELRGRSKQAVDQSLLNLARKYLSAYPELLEEESQ